jgi:hypothetical protein
MKKLLSVMLTAVFSIGLFGMQVQADGTVSEKMEKSILKKVQGAHYDYKEDTLSFSEVETFNGSEENTIVVAIAHYETVRDDFFITSHSEVVYFDQTNEVVLKSSDVAGISAIAAYKKAHKGDLGAHMHFSIILLYHVLVVLIPVLIMAVWMKRQYSTTQYQVDNNILGQQQSFN